MLTEKEIKVLEFRRNGLTQREVAKKLNISQAAVSSFEKNAMNKIEDAKKVRDLAKSLMLNR
ncbi:MAG: LuxR C-terminal-related transcriptional regulator [Candidatus Nanoarchaeia archaeon]